MRELLKQWHNKKVIIEMFQLYRLSACASRRVESKSLVDDAIASISQKVIIETGVNIHGVSSQRGLICSGEFKH